MPKRGGLLKNLAAKPNAVTPRRASAPGSCLVAVDEDHDAQHERKKSTPEPKSESLEAKVGRCIRDNFKTWSVEKTDFTLRGGMSLRERIRNDKQRHTNGEPIMFGKTYFQELRALYSSPGDPEAHLNVRNEDEVVDPKFAVALEGLFDRVKNYDSVITMLESMELCNQKSLVGLLRATLMVNPSSTLEGNRFVVAVASYLARTKAAEAFGAEIDQLKKHFDWALVQSLTNFKKAELSAIDWWRKFNGAAGLVLPHVAADKCFKCVTKWNAVEAELSAVVSSCDLGYALFGRALHSLTEARVDDVSKTSVAALEGREISTALIAQARQTFSADVKKLGVDPIDVYSSPKVVACNYRGVTLSIATVSVMDGWHCRLWCYIKTVAVTGKQVESLFCEDQLVGGFEVVDGSTIADELLVDMISARKACQRFVPPGAEVTADMLKDIFSKRVPFLSTIDRMIKIEVLFFESASGKKGEDRFKDEVLLCLSRREKPKTTAESIVALERLGESRLAAWVGTAAVATLQMVQACVKCLHEQRPPRFDASMNARFVEDVKEALGAFLLIKPTEGSADAEVLSGVQAAKFLVKDCVGKMGAGQLEMQDLRLPLAYSWLLEKADLDKVETWRAKLVAQGPDLVRRPSAPKSGALKKKHSEKQLVVQTLFKKR